jgi:hypothetical protein
MQFPKELNELLTYFFQDVAAFAVRSTNESDRLKVGRYLDGLLGEPHDLDELERLGWASPADIAPKDRNKIPRWLRLIADEIDKQSSSR